MKKVLIFGTLDTKLQPFLYLKSVLETRGIQTMLMDVGLTFQEQTVPDVPRRTLFSSVGLTENEWKKLDSRAEKMKLITRAARQVTCDLMKGGRLCGAITMCGGQGAHIAAAVMAALPIGFPKVIVSTVTNSAIAGAYLEGVNDTVMLNSLVDIQGMNSVLARTVRKAAAIMCGMLQQPDVEERDHKKRVGITMFGITTPCVSRLEKRLEEAGYEVVVFHTTGQGGRIFEAMIRDGWFDGIADVTLGEITAELFGINGSAGKERLTAAAERGVPMVVVPGAVDVLTFSPASAVPKKYDGRPYIMHSEDVKVVRTNAEENVAIARDVCRKLAHANGPTLVALPLRGVSENDRVGKPFYSQKSDEALFDVFREERGRKYALLELENHINDPEFADAISEWLVETMQKNESQRM